MRRGRSVCVLVTVAMVGLAPAQAHADAHEPPHQLAFSPARDWSILGAGVAVNLGLALGFARRNVGCRWCDYDGDRSTLNGFDSAGRRLRWQRPARAATISDMTLIATPVLASSALVWMGRHAGASVNESVQDLVMVGQAAAVSGALTQVAKITFRRSRPYAHARGPGVADEAADDSVSFFSGHASTTFAFASSAATVATLRGYRAAPWMWTGMALAGTTGYLRVAADKHYVTDVLLGTLVGSAVGVGMTYWLHGREAKPGDEAGVLAAAVNGGMADDATMFSVSGAF